MAKFLVTSGSYFEPFTYDELAKPVMQTVEAHNAAQDVYDAMSDQTELLRRYVDQEPENSIVRQRYNDYVQKLSNLQNNLWQHGYNAGTRRDLSIARAGYNSDINRIGTSIKTRQDRSAAYHKFKAEHPDAVMGIDPGLSSLDNYFNDDLYGQNYFQYDGKQFEASVATEIQAKAQELLNSNVIKDKDLVAQLTRITRYGVSNDDIAEASPIVDALIDADADTRDKYYKEHNVSNAAQLLVETLINRYDATGIRDSDAPESERQRMLGYGKSGWAHGVMKPEQKDFENPEYKEQQSIRMMNRQHQLNKDLEKYKYDLQHPAPDPNAPYSFHNFMDSYEVTGENHEKKKKTVNERIDFKEPQKLFSSSGAEITDHATASELVFGGNERRQLYDYFGFDYGRDPEWGIDGLTPSSRFLSGKITVNNVEYNTRYNPHKKYTDPKTGETMKGAIEVWTDDVNNAKIDLERTQRYKAARQRYEDRVEHYKTKEKDIYKAATINPDKQYDYYKEDGLGFDVPLTEYKTSVMSLPGNSVNAVHNLYIAEKGTDSGDYLGRLSGKLSLGFTVTEASKGNYIGQFNIGGEPYKGRDYNESVAGFHTINKHGDISKDAIKDPNKVFAFDKNGITNVTSAYVDENALVNGYVIVTTTKSASPITVPVSYLRDDNLKGAFITCQQQYAELMDNANASDYAKYMGTLMILDGLCSKVKSAVGYIENTQSQGGTNKDDTN